MELLLRIIPPCLFNRLTGLYCPGCGGTRATHALLTGHVMRSIYYHPLVVYTVVCVGWYLIKRVVEKVTSNKWSIPMLAPKLLLNGAVAIVIINVLFRNIAYLVWGLTL